MRARANTSKPRNIYVSYNLSYSERTVSFVPLFSIIIILGFEALSSLYRDYATFFLAKLTTFIYTTLTNLSTKYLMMSEIYTNVGGIKYSYHVCPPVRKIIHSLKLVDYLHVQADNPW